MRVLQVVTNIRGLSGGLAISARGLSAALARRGADVEIFTVGAPDAEEGGRPELAGERGPVVRTFPPAFPRAWRRSPALLRRLRSAAAGFDVAHLHGLWRHPVTAGARLLRRIGVPYVVTVHGLLNPLALSRRGWVKRPYLALLERRTLLGASAIHCLSEGEARSIRRLGLRGRTIILPNGIAEDDLRRPARRNLLRERFPALRGKRIILYLGRLVPAKGVPLLLPALRMVQVDHPEAHLVLAGGVRAGERGRLEALAARLGVRESVTRTGLLSQEEKWDALDDADLFVLPSREEGDSLSVLEALARGLPVILGPGPAYPDPASRGIGWRVSAEPASIAAAIAEAFRSPARARETGEAGRRWVLSERSWDRIAARWLENYGRISEGSRGGRGARRRHHR